MNWDSCELTVENCTYFYDALMLVWARIVRGGDVTIHGFDLKPILDKTNDGWIFVEFSRFRYHTEYLKTKAFEISTKLNGPEIEIVNKVARAEKRLLRLQMEGMMIYAG